MSDLSKSPNTAPTASHLTNIIARASGVTLDSDDKLRRYRAVVTSSTQINRKVDVDCKSVVYNIGRRGAEGVALEKHAQNTVRIDTAVAVNDVVKADLNAFARKYSAFPSSWEVFDLAGVVERLAKGLAHYANFGTLTQQQLRGGEEASIIAIGAMVKPLAACNGHVFVPAGSEAGMSPHILAALVDAVSGEGGTLVTDLVALSAESNRILVPKAEGEDLAFGCYHALRLIASNYMAHGAGGVFAYALTRGMHAGCTVFGHTDEGGIMRDVLRRGAFAAPRGGIVTTAPSYVGLPQPTGGLASFQKLVDNVLLATAGAVALCDPCVTIDGRVYPTVFTSSVSALSESGVGVAGTAEDAKRNISSLYASMGEFAPLYMRALNEIFCTQGGEQECVRHMVGVVGTMIGKSYAHLRHSAVAPYFWVEPTGVVNINAGDYVAGQQGYAHLCTSRQPREHPAFADCELVVEGALSSSWYVDWRVARRHAMLVHLAGHADDGLAYFTPRQMDPEAVAFLGASSETDNTVRARVTRGDDLSEYLWGRGHSALVAPAEFMYTGRAVGLCIKHNTASDDGYDIDINHAPRPDEMRQGVLFSVSTLDMLPVGNLRATPREVMRSRNTATRALFAARLRTAGVPTMAAEMPVAFCDFGMAVGTPTSRKNAEEAAASPAGDLDARQGQTGQQAEGTVGATKPYSTGEGAIASTTVKMATSVGPRPTRGAVAPVATGVRSTEAEHADVPAEAQ